MKFQKIMVLVLALVVTGVSTQALADRRAGTAEVTLFVPYLFGETFDFDGGAGVELDSDVGFGIGFGYNYTENLSFTADVSWNGLKYNATRVIDDGSNSIDTFNGKLDTWSLRFGGDYYFTNGSFSPFVNANLGWNFIDTNIADGPPGAVCWWDPWWGYICQGYQDTYKEDNFMYGVGVGLRMEIGRSNFAKLGYYSEWMDFSSSTGSSTMDSIRLEFGFSF